MASDNYQVGKVFYNDRVSLGLPRLPPHLTLDRASSSSVPVAKDTIGLHYSPQNGAWTLQDRN